MSSCSTGRRVFLSSKTTRTRLLDEQQDVFCKLDHTSSLLNSLHPRGTGEAPRRHPGAQRQLGSRMCVFIFVFSRSDATGHFCMDGSDLTITVDRACPQECADAGGTEIGDVQTPNTEDNNKVTPPEPYSRNCLLAAQ